MEIIFLQQNIITQNNDQNGRQTNDYPQVQSGWREHS